MPLTDCLSRTLQSGEPWRGMWIFPESYPLLKACKVLGADQTDTHFSRQVVFLSTKSYCLSGHLGWIRELVVLVHVMCTSCIQCGPCLTVLECLSFRRWKKSVECERHLWQLATLFLLKTYISDEQLFFSFFIFLVVDLTVYASLPPALPSLFLFLSQACDNLSDHLLRAVLNLLRREVSEHGRHLQQYFNLFVMYANLGKHPSPVHSTCSSGLLSPLPPGSYSDPFSVSVVCVT